MPNLSRIITGATGLIGQTMVQNWVKNDQHVVAVTRNKAQAQKKLPDGVEIITWDELNTDIIGGAECILNLAGENIGKKAWSESQKKVIIQSRVDATQRIAKLCVELGDASPRLLNASGIGIYGLQAGKKKKLPQVFHEETTREPGVDFLSEVSEQWEKAVQPAIDANVKVIILRFGVVLSHFGGALPEFEKMAKSYFACPISNGYQPISWIHINDVCGAINHLIEHPEIEGAVNIVTPEATAQGNFLELLCKSMHKPYWPNAMWRKPFNFMLSKILGDNKYHCLLALGQNVKPNVLLKTQFDYAYPDLEKAFTQIYRD